MLRIEYELKNRGFSQTSLAEAVGCQRVSINRIVNGKERAYRNRGRRIARALGWPEDRFEELFEEIELDDEKKD